MSSLFGVPGGIVVNKIGESVSGTLTTGAQESGTVNNSGAPRSLIQQLFSTTVDPSKSYVDITGVGKSEIQAAQTINALKAALDGGFISDEAYEEAIDSTQGSHFSQFVGSFRFPQIEEAIKYYYYSSVYAQMTRKVKDMEKSDFVLSSGIKKGATCIIKISQGPSKTISSWLDRVASDSSYKGTSNLFTKLSVQSVNEPLEERYQIVQTFGADILYAFGKRPTMIMISGMILNGSTNLKIGQQTYSMDWKNALQRFYNKNRATKSITRGGTIDIILQDTVYRGYLLNLITNFNAENQGVAQVTMTLVLKKMNYLQKNDSAIPPKEFKEGLPVGSKSFPKEFLSDPSSINSFVDDVKTTSESTYEDIRNSLKDLIIALYQKMSSDNRRIKINDDIIDSESHRGYFGIDEASSVNKFINPLPGIYIHPMALFIAYSVREDSEYTNALAEESYTPYPDPITLNLDQNSFIENPELLLSKDSYGGSPPTDNLKTASVRWNFIFNYFYGIASTSDAVQKKMESLKSKIEQPRILPLNLKFQTPSDEGFSLAQPTPCNGESYALFNEYAVDSNQKKTVSLALFKGQKYEVNEGAVVIKNDEDFLSDYSHLKMPELMPFEEVLEKTKDAMSLYIYLGDGTGDYFGSRSKYLSCHKQYITLKEEDIQTIRAEYIASSLLIMTVQVAQRYNNMYISQLRERLGGVNALCSAIMSTDARLKNWKGLKDKLNS